MEEIGFISVLALGFMLGIKHAIEPDHVIAVSTIASQSKKLWRSSLAGMSWGIGHTATLFLVGMTMVLMKREITEQWAMSLEFLVGVMLVYFGITTVISYKKTHAHSPAAGGSVLHNDSKSEMNNPSTGFQLLYTKSLFMGFIHGLAGSAAMILLTMSTVQNAWEGALYILIFGAGTIIGMLLSTTIIGIPFVLSSNQIYINKSLTQITGLISIFFGIYYMYNLGMNEGLFMLWIQ
ncbi:sulfite exporter TauE/SafE family protein [Domibacillus robiginosus]|uniref:HoxN/HupN/NixA family nickel/cobalt transporter n=1 Tax=Domibacillus robiginosus TaxID=1071054 RepID=UPI00067D7BBC|nr:sulfite exporter TauE/SafE family protein [Domibacillus robiginosus]